MSNFTKLMAQAAAGVGGEFYGYKIEESLRSNPADLAELSRTFGTATSRTTFTISFWAKKSSAGQTLTNVMAKEVSAASEEYVGFYLDSIRFYNGATGNPGIFSVEKDRDLSAWYHYLIAVDTTQATASDRIRIYKNGTEITYGANSNPSQNQNLTINSSGLHKIINFASTTYSGSTYRWNGYLAEFVFIDGTAYAPTDLGQSKNGVWIPKDPSGLTYGNNGFWLKFDNASSLGTDSSGNGNNWTVTNFASNDQMIDTPTNNFPTFNGASYTSANVTLSDGSLKAFSSTNGYSNVDSTFPLPKTSKTYFEISTPDLSDAYRLNHSICHLPIGNMPQYPWYSPAFAWNNAYSTTNVNLSTATDFSNSPSTSTITGVTFSAGDIWGIAYDGDTGKVWLRHNGTWLNSGDPAAGTGNVTTLSTDYDYHYAAHINVTGSGNSVVLNAGQNGTFNGTKTAQGNSDGNSIGDFYYSVPTGFLAPCTANLPEPTIGPNSTTTSNDNFDTLLYNIASPQAVTGLEFQPDFVWIKNRDNAYYHGLYDAVRGASNSIYSNGIETENTYTANQKLASFDSNGFTVDSTTSTNVLIGNCVAWNWKANGSGSSNTDGSITSTVSANQDAGISIITYTGNGTSGATIGHGLNAVPKSIWVKDRGDTNAFTNYFESLGTGSELYFAYSQAKTNSNFWITSPTTSVFSASSSEYVNASAHTYVAYAFAEVEGFSKIGQYTGNGSNDGPFIYTGFRPAWVLIKNTSASNSWLLYDTKRIGYNQSNNYLLPDLANAEGSGDNYIDILSNGFKVRVGLQSINTSGYTYIFMCFAENPFKYSNAR